MAATMQGMRFLPYLKPEEEQRLIATAAQLTTTRVLLFDLTRNGDPVATFGANGVLSIAEAPASTINAQVAHQGVGAALRVMSEGENPAF